MTFRDYVDAHEDSRALLQQLREAILRVGPVEEHESKSQIAYRRGRAFALVWAPGQYLGERGAPLVLSVVLPERDADPRWKEIAEPRPGAFLHHLELRVADDVDDQVTAWIARAYAAAR